MYSQNTLIHVLDFVPNAQRSMEQFLIGLDERLRSKGWRTVYVFSGAPGEHFQSQLRSLDSPYFVAKFPLSWGDVPGLVDQMREYQPTAIQVCFMSPFNLALWRLKRALGARHFVYVDQSSGAASKKGRMKRLLAWARGAAAGRFIDRIVTVSNFNRRRDIEHSYHAAEKFLTIYNGIDTDKYNFASKKPADCNPTTIAFVGQLIPEKGVHTLIQAVKELIEEDKLSLRLQIAGAGHQAGELERYCIENELTQIEFLGQIDWVQQLFARSDIAVIPSIWEEAFGFTVAEAMACGACVIASDAGGIPEVVGPGGEAGVIFRRGNVGDLKSQLRELISDPDRRERMGRRARERVIEKFSIGRMIEEYAILIEELENRPTNHKQ